MSDILTMYRKTLEDESKMLGTPDSCTINRAMELVASAYTLGKLRLEEDKLREKYSGLAMQAILSNSNREVLGIFKTQADIEQKEIRQIVARSAVELADALVKELKRNKEK